MDKTRSVERRADLLQSIERDQEKVRAAVRELAVAVRSRLDPGEPIRKSPLTWAMGALLVGAWWGWSSKSANVAARGR